MDFTQCFQKQVKHINLITNKHKNHINHKGGSPNWLKLAWDWLWTPRFNPLEMTSANKSVMAFNLSYMFEQTEIFTEMCNALLQFVKEKKLKIAKVTSFNLSDVESAHKLIESGTSVGKLVLIPDEINSGKQSKKEK